MLFTRARCVLAVSALALMAIACQTFGRRAGAPPEASSTSPSTPVEPVAVKKIEEEIVIAAWAEPKRLPSGGGQAQLLIRVQKRGGARFPGVEVSLGATTGSLYSAGRILMTDSEGMTRDRITTHKTATVTLNAGGTRYRFQVPVGEETPQE
jgi:hypothetical protein